MPTGPSLQYYNLQWADTIKALDIERAGQAIATYSDILEHELNTLVDEDYTTWDDTGSWVLTDTEASGTTGDILLTEVLVGTSLGIESYVLTQYLDPTGETLIYVKRKDADQYYAVRLENTQISIEVADTNDYPDNEPYPATRGRVLQRRNYEIDCTGPARWEIYVRRGVREHMAGMGISIWRDNEFIIAGYDPIDLIDTTVIDNSWKYIGYEVISGSLTVRGTRIAECCQSVEYCCIDPGEAAGKGLDRAIGSRHVDYFARYNGHFRLKRGSLTKPRATILTDNEITSFNEQYDRRRMLSSIQLIGAYHDARTASNEKFKKLHTRFARFDNPDMMNEAEAEDEAAWQMRKSEEEAHTCSFGAPLYPQLEINDGIETNIIDANLSTRVIQKWIINSLNIEQKATKDAPELQMKLECRAYVEDDWDDS